MDYFRQRRAYRNFKQNEATISMGQNNLYRELLDYANDCGKLDGWFPLKNSALVDLTGLSESGMREARNSLIQFQLIEYRKGNKKSKTPPQYKIICLYSQTKSIEKVPQTEHIEYRKQSGSSDTNRAEVVTQTGTHKELTNTRLILDNNLTGSSISNTTKQLDSGAVAYWLNQVNPAEAPSILESISLWVKDYQGQDDLVILAIDEMLKNNARSYNYLDKILKNWETKGLDSLEKVKKHLTGYYERTNQKYKNTHKPNVRREKIPDYIQRALDAEEARKHEEGDT